MATTFLSFLDEMAAFNRKIIRRDAGLSDDVGGASAPADGAPTSSVGPEGPAPYLELSHNTVEQEQEEQWPEGEEAWELRACGCRSWFCDHCCKGKGLDLRNRLVEAIKEWKGLMMLTFTTDPELFGGPEQAYEYIREHRAVSETIRTLHRWGHLHSRQFMCVLEWQENGWAHWHVLVEAGRIPFEKLCEAWNRNHAESGERIKAGRPGLGSVRFSKGDFKSAEHAARYATKYLIKPPKYGYPAWVLARPVRSVHRYSTSRGLLPPVKEEPEDREEKDRDESLQAQVEGLAIRVESGEESAWFKLATGEALRTVGQSRDACGESSALFRFWHGRFWFVERIPVKLAAIAAEDPWGVFGTVNKTGKRLLVNGREAMRSFMVNFGALLGHRVEVGEDE